MFEEQFTISQTQIIQTPEMVNPVARVRYGTETKFSTERKFLGFIKFKKYSHTVTEWENEFVDYDIKTGEVINVTKSKTKRQKLDKQATVVTGEDK